MKNKNIYWQRIRGIAIIAVVYIHSQTAMGSHLNNFNGISYFLIRNILNFPVDMFFFMSGFFMNPIDDLKAFYKKRLPKLVLPYLFYTIAYLGISAICGSEINSKRLLLAVFLGTASTPLYYIVVLTYFTILAPFLLKAVHSKKKSVIILASTPAFLSLAFIIRITGTDVWKYLKYTPVWISFYYLGMIVREYKPTFKKSVLWILLIVSFISELISTALLSNIKGFNAYTQLRFTGAFYSLILILLAYRYSKETYKNDKGRWLAVIGDDSYTIYYMHCAFLMLFDKVIPFDNNMILPLYQIGEIFFAVLMCELFVYIIKKAIKNIKLRMIFGV